MATYPSPQDRLTHRRSSKKTKQKNTHAPDHSEVCEWLELVPSKRWLKCDSQFAVLGLYHRLGLKLVLRLPDLVRHLGLNVNLCFYWSNQLHCMNRLLISTAFFFPALVDGVEKSVRIDRWRNHWNRVPTFFDTSWSCTSNFEAKNESWYLRLVRFGPKFSHFQGSYWIIYPWLMGSLLAFVEQFLGTALQRSVLRPIAWFKTGIQGTISSILFMFILICGFSLRPVVWGIISTADYF